MRVLVVEDEEYLAEAIATGLRREAMAVDVVGDGASALEQVEINDYDIIVLDRDLPVIHGDEVCRRVVAEHPSTRVLMLTASRTLDARVGGFELGADDYLTKPFEFPELVARLRAVLRRVNEGGSATPSPDALILGDLTITPANRVCLWQGESLELTATEFNMLVLLVRAPEQVVTKDILSLQGVGRPREAYDRSVDVHICNLRQKLQQKAGEAVTIETVRSIGYKIR